MLSAKIAYRNLPKRRARTALTILAVILGVALLVGINLATASATGEFTNYINKFWGHTDIVVSYGGLPPVFQTNYLDKVESVSEVQQTAVRLVWFGTTDNRTFFPLVGVNGTDFDYSSFNITGTRSLAQGQATVDDGLAQKFGLRVGSNINVFTPNLFARTNVTITLSVVGINHPLRNIGASIYVYLPQLQSELSFQGMISHIYATLKDPTRAPQVRDEIQHLLDSPLFNISAPKAEAVQRIAGQTAGFELGLNVMVAVALVVCAFIVFNTLFMTVNERTYEIGVMRAVGTSRSQIFRIFLTEGMLIGTVGTIAGVVTGLALSRAFTAVAENILQIPSLPLVQLTPTITLMGLGAGFAAVFAGSLYPAASASRINIIQAIRPSARNSRTKVPDSIIVIVSVGMLTLGSLEAARLTPFHVPYLDVALIPFGLVILGAVLFGRSGRVLTAPLLPFSRAVGYVASRNGRRRLLRNAISFGMITITLSFVIMLGGIQGGVQTALDQGIQEALGADIILIANQSLPISFANNLTSLPQISTATPLGPSFFPVSPKVFGPKGNNTSVGVLAVDPTVFPQIINYQFVNSPSPQQVYAQLASNNQTVLLPDSLATRLGVSTGGKITMDIPTPVDFRVAGIFTGPVLQYIQFGNSFASDTIVVSFNSQNKFFGGHYNAPLFLVDLKPQYKSAASPIARDIASSYPKYDFAENSLTLGQLLSLVRDTINRIFTIILLVLYFALLIATLGISATMIMNVTDRKREIGLLRSQGMSRRQVSGLFLSEGILLGVFGFLLAIPGGLLLLEGATNSTTLAGFYLPFVVPYVAMLQSFGLAILAVVAGSLYPALRASRMEITKALEQA
ncbi:MAG TPA: FtsX-like permease family protein [Candidatus Bathyarchaeia archaeon]|nr:FtsX-like permease family protein [Candidatus Bathyarchaeia archaeon]